LRIWIGGLWRLRRSDSCSGTVATAGTRTGSAAGTRTGSAADTTAATTIATNTIAADDVLGYGVVGSAPTEH
jgi:hypothetical protein